MVVLTISDPTHVSEAKRVAVRMADQRGFDEVGRGKLAIVITEAATNLLKHAGGGSMILRSISNSDHQGIEMLASDSGVGIANIADCLRDGFSTAGSPGTGLGAIFRLSSSWNVFSMAGQGTILQSISWSTPPVSQPQIDIAALWRPVTGETFCGDACGSRSTETGFLAMIADGLGHGVLAADASNKAVDVFYRSESVSPKQLLESMHDALRDTRGAAIGIAEIDLEKSVVRFSGVGNITGAVVDAANCKHLVSMNGIVGHQAKSFREFDTPWSDSSILILHSDGLKTRWDLGKYPGIRNKPASMLAAALLRDEARGTDDASVQVAKVNWENTQ